MSANETIADIVAEMRDAKSVYDRYRCGGADCDAIDTLATISAYADRIEAARKREQELLRSCARWISTHDIYGNMSKELLEECANVLDDDGEFLELEGEDEHIGKSC